jgi:truncated hemoglobin YjbI
MINERLAMRNRPIEEKESNRWLETMENAERDIGDDIKILHVCDREGDIYFFCG